VVSLRDHLLAGRLTLDEFSERVEQAYRARTSDELARVRTDLPQTSEPVRLRRRPTRFTAALFGHVARRGRLRLGASTLAVAAFADLDLDLREAEIDAPETVVTVLVAFGNIDVYVPEGVNVDVGGLTLFGHRREWGRDDARADAPTIRIQALGWFATVDVWRVPRELQGGYREIIRQIEERQRLPPA
jgi:hypothetical protein